MDKKVNIPVRVIHPAYSPAVAPGVSAGSPPVSHYNQPTPRVFRVERDAEDSAATPRPTVEAQDVRANNQEEVQEWRDRALRLQADIDNFRRRQQRLAEEQIETERQRLWRAFFQVVDNLERALAVPVGDGAGLRQGIELTHHGALLLLKQEGIEQIQALGMPFDPAWHEAVASVETDHHNVAPNTVVQVLEPGYRLGEHLLRAARVVVAV